MDNFNRSVGRKIVTENIFPPIPDRRFDWIAYYEGEEERGRYGYGSTKDEAIAELVNDWGDDLSEVYGDTDAQ